MPANKQPSAFIQVAGGASLTAERERQSSQRHRSVAARQAHPSAAMIDSQGVLTTDSRFENLRQPQNARIAQLIAVENQRLQRARAADRVERLLEGADEAARRKREPCSSVGCKSTCRAEQAMKLSPDIAGVRAAGDRAVSEVEVRQARRTRNHVAQTANGAAKRIGPE
jgi:hypothetical protein